VSGLPRGWAKAKVGEVGQVQLGRQRSPEHHQGPQMRPYLRVANVFEGFIDTSDIMSMNFNDADYERFALRSGDVLLNEGQSKELVGRPAIYNGEVPGSCFTNSLVRYSPGPAVEAGYAYQLFRHYLHSGAFQNIAQITTNIAHLGAGRFANMDILVPPLPEQRRIVAKLDALFERTRKAKESLDRIPAMLERLRQSVFAAAFRGDLTKRWREARPDMEAITRTIAKVALGESRTGGREATDTVIEGRYALAVGDPGSDAPSGWKWVPLGTVARMESGHTPSRRHDDYWNGGIPWIGIKDARENHGRRISRTDQTVSPQGLANSSSRLLPKDTVCLSRTASVGYVTIMDREMATSQDFANWVCSDAIVPEFLMFLLMAEKDSLFTFGKGTTHTTIYFPELKAFHVCLPPVPEQREIVRRIQTRFEIAASMEKIIAEKQGNLGELDPAILAKAFRGELVPQDPNDEPAYALLDRIRAEKESADAPSRGRRRKAG
jgi:type I restriction enzyme S subunit